MKSRTANPCRGCSTCCDAVVAITHRDLALLQQRFGRRTASHLTLHDPANVSDPLNEEDLALTRYGRRLLGLRLAKGGCIFLGPDAACTIYPHRPLLCRAFPFFAEGKHGQRIGKSGLAIRLKSGCHIATQGPAPSSIRDAQEEFRAAETYRRLLQNWEKLPLRPHQRTLRCLLTYLTAPNSRQ